MSATPTSTNAATPTPAPSPTSTTPTHPPAPLSIHYVDVGQGDGTIWQLPDGTIVIYDCGDAASGPDANPMVQKLRQLGVTSGETIHALVASHGHLDHIGGCEEILNEYDVSHLYEAWYDGADAPRSYTRFRDQIKNEGGIIHTLRATTVLSNEEILDQWETLDLPMTSGVTATLIYPATFVTSDWDDIADSSLTIRLVHGTNAFCFQGDIETAQENKIAAYAQDLSCDVYLAGHHGSKYASTTPWLTKMGPEHAVASFGTNSYGHPTSEALCRIQTAGAQIYATHRTGTITFTSNGSVVNTTAAPETKNYCATGASYWNNTPTPGASPATTPSPGPTQSPGPTPSPNPAPTPTPQITPAPNNAPPQGPLTLTASTSDETPCRYSTVTITVTVNDANGNAIGGAAVESAWHYKSTTSYEDGTTNSAGVTYLSRSISSATAGYAVQVDITAAKGGVTSSISTSFTPITC